MKRKKNKCQSKNCSNCPIKHFAKLTTKILTALYKPKVIKFKLDEDPLQSRVYLLSIIDLLIIVLSQFKKAYMFIMDYPYIIG